MNSTLNTAATENDVRLKLLGVIGQLKEQQRIFFESQGIVELSKEQVDIIEKATELRPDFQCDPALGHMYGDLLLEYDNLKTRDLADLTGVTLGLLRPVYLRMVETGEIMKEEVSFLDFLLYLLNHPK